MKEKHAWMVRAGNYNELVGDFWEKSLVAIGPPKVGDLTSLSTREEFKARLKEAFPEWSETSLSVNSGKIYRFAKEIQVGDYVLSYSKASREYLVGEVAGELLYDPEAVGDNYPHVRRVKWIKKIPRDLFSSKAKNALGSTLTVFNADAHMKEIEGLMAGERPSEIGEPVEGVTYYEEVKGKSDELISDIISKIDPYEFQNLVAAILRAMGFRTTVSLPGPDMGVDIIAHPDAFGFQSPRIKVQVKHKLFPASGPDIRNFVATLREGENGLFISTGGYTKDARFEAEKAARRITLLDRDAFVDLLIENYENLEPEYEAMVPLKKVYIPAKT